MADLRTDYKDDILDTSVNTQRKYNVVNNDDGTVSFEDATVYAQNGDTFGASEVNQIHAAVNLVNESLNVDTTNLKEDFTLNGLLQYLAEKYFAKILYLLKNGVVDESITTFSNTNYTSTNATYTTVYTQTTYNNGVATVKVSGSEYATIGTWFSDEVFDVTEKKYLKVKVQNCAFHSSDWGAWLGLTPTKINKYVPSAEVGFSSAVEKTFTIDVTQLSGEQYFYLRIGGGGSYVNVVDIWFE